jgi:hypothetical protein
MTYAVSVPVRIAHVLAGVAAGLETELPHLSAHQVANAVQSAHTLANQFLPDLSSYADAVARFARASLAR